jgi:hypothetical protein
MEFLCRGCLPQRFGTQTYDHVLQGKPHFSNGLELPNVFLSPWLNASYAGVNGFDGPAMAIQVAGASCFCWVNPRESIIKTILLSHCIQSSFLFNTTFHELRLTSTQQTTSWTRYRKSSARSQASPSCRPQSWARMVRRSPDWDMAQWVWYVFWELTIHITTASC